MNSKLVTFAQQELVLSHNDSERDKINASLTQLEKILKDKLGTQVLEFVRFGSFTRNTILPRTYDPQSDIDLMVVFNTSNGRKTPGTYRKNLLDIVTLAYPNSISKKDFPVVKLLLNHIMFDIVPAYKDTRFYTTYHIPDSGDTWRETKPNDLNDKLASENQKYGHNTVRNVIRLCKHWNANKSYPFESYLLEKEILTLSFTGDDTYSGFVYALSKIATNISGVSQALEYLRQYKNQNNDAKQFEWLQRLLPGLN